MNRAVSVSIGFLLIIILFFGILIPSASGDSDFDGISNTQESYYGTNANDADTDDDGVADGAEPNWNKDTDGDGLINAKDPDSDNDGLTDGLEMGITKPVPGSGLYQGTDTSATYNNGTCNCYNIDEDPETTTDMLKWDSDNDTWSDGFEDTNKNGKIDLGEMNPKLKDFDNDRLDDDTVDLDDDNDGMYDDFEQTFDKLDPINSSDADLDNDEDGYNNLREYLGYDNLPGNQDWSDPNDEYSIPIVDKDEDGVDDTIDKFPNDPGEWNDTDNDYFGDNIDPDDDNDLMPDWYEDDYRFDPRNATDASLDPDLDGFTNVQEFYGPDGSPEGADYTDPLNISSYPGSTIGQENGNDDTGSGSDDSDDSFLMILIIVIVVVIIVIAVVAGVMVSQKKKAKNAYGYGTQTQQYYQDQRVSATQNTSQYSAQTPPAPAPPTQPQPPVLTQTQTAPTYTEIAAQPVEQQQYAYPESQGYDYASAPAPEPAPPQETTYIPPPQEQIPAPATTPEISTPTQVPAPAEPGGVTIVPDQSESSISTDTKSSITPKQKIELLEGRLLRGEISQEIYLNLKSKFEHDAEELKLKQKQANSQEQELIPATQPPAQEQAPLQTVPCPICQNMITAYSTPCQFCGTSLDW